ncbi:hypothetical protein [Nocardia jejuensis]|uniref:hypothetical protein n=1 Tax=Nocardia jejuensis TaxID=328049 RepID=UPI0008331D45|nr:hypothetical protein [Nocardia jejuensis]
MSIATTTARDTAESVAAQQLPANESTIEQFEPSVETEWRRRKARPLSAEQIVDYAARLDATATGRTVIEVDPDDLVFGNNIRTNAITTLTPDFLSSIAEKGFEQSPTAWINPDGFLQVKTGHRRTLAARQVEYRPCPIMLVRAPEGTSDSTRRVSEIGDQWAENEHREAMTDSDKYGTVLELLTLGETPAKVNQRLKNISTREATAVRRISKARAATAAQAAAVAGELDLLQAAAAAELDPTAEEMKRLITGARSGQFDRTLISIGHERRAAAAVRKARAEFKKKGYTVMDHEPSQWDTSRPKKLSELITPGGRAATVKDVTSPAHWSVFLSHQETPVLIATGEAITDSDIDPATYLDPDAVPAEGKHHAAQVRFDAAPVAAYYCTDRKAAGLKIAPTTSSVPRDPNQGAANKRAMHANTFARIDTEARREFITGTLLKRKTLPKGFTQWIAHNLLTDPAALSDGNARSLIAEWTGLKIGYGRTADATKISGYDDALAPDKQKTTDARALMLTATAFIAATEAAMQADVKRPNYWRVTQDNPHVCYLRDTSGYARYLRLLVSAGYTPGPIERAVMGEISLTDAITEAQKTATA